MIHRRLAQFAVITLLLAASSLADAAQWGHWGKATKPAKQWADYTDARPDMLPDAWLVKRLVDAGDDEIMLRSSNGAMLRWVDADQLRALYNVSQKILSAAETRADLYITQGDSPNAAAGLHEGKPVMFVNFAMLDLVGYDEDEWAALVGHEVAHLKLKHGEKHAKRNIPLNIIKTVGGAVLNDPLSATAGNLLLDGIANKFSRDDEREADYMGVIWAVQMDYDAYGAAHLHQRMNDEGGGGAPLPFLSTHPSGPERIKTLTELADRLSEN
ncbi:MAG: M48 family metalloprotease [Pseudomonadales bacterium]|nr:M48 family metalloprotease [Pseudomonadales bacterium]